MVHSHVVIFYIVICFLVYVSFRHTDDHDISCIIHVVHFHTLRADSLLHMHTHTQGCYACSHAVPTCKPVVFLLWHFGLARLWAVLDSYLFTRVLIRQLC